jgi:molybdate transport system regulatory protein
MPAAKRRAQANSQLLPRLRITRGREIALGPGKVDLREHIAATGSIAEAATRMDMSYMRAWLLIKTMNAGFKEPLVEAVRGGRQGGGARLSETGRRALALYQGMEASCRSAMKRDRAALKKLLRP